MREKSKDMRNVVVGELILGSDEILKVTKVTPTQVVCRHQRFRREDGKEIGGYGWTFAHTLLEADPKLVKDKFGRRMRAVLHQHIVIAAKGADLRSASIEELQAIKEALAKFPRLPHY